MPAVSVQDVTKLPRIPVVDTKLRERSVVKVVDAPRMLEGEGFEVRRAFSGVDLSLADPFLLLDHLGAVEYSPGEAKGAPDHPHRGFETVTYMMDGKLEHRDSNGGGGVITDGATQWMTAGAGIVHSEMPTQDLVAKGGLFHGTQLWVNLPKSLKWSAPAYQDITGDKISLLASDDAGAYLRLIAGELAGHAGPGNTRTPITYAHATVAPGARLQTPWRTDFNALVYVLAGRGRVGSQGGGMAIQEGQLAVLGHGDYLTISGDEVLDSPSPTLEVLLMGGLPIREQIAWYGPFVMNTREELMQAVQDYQAGKMGSIPARERSLGGEAGR
ncbi:MAG: pirin family protein [Chloroflexi bacterium]|nr:pirin family protein [Chloroflexota bacterium]